jgi:gas vesicle protein
LGPRAARVHLGAGRPGVSTGAGRFTYWAPVGGQKKSSRSSSGSASRTSIASYQRQLREADRQGGIERIRDVESALISLHKKPFPPARRPKAPEPEPVDMKSIHRRARKEELSSVSPFRFSKRRTAKRRADEKAIRDIAEEKGKRLATTKQQQVELDREWSDLIDNQPETVMAALETAFEDNQDPAAPVDSEGSRASIVILYPPQDFMPDKEACPHTHRQTNAQTEEQDRNK